METRRGEEQGEINASGRRSLWHCGGLQYQPAAALVFSGLQPLDEGDEDPSLVPGPVPVPCRVSCALGLSSQVACACAAGLVPGWYRVLVSTLRGRLRGRYSARKIRCRRSRWPRSARGRDVAWPSYWIGLSWCCQPKHEIRPAVCTLHFAQRRWIVVSCRVGIEPSGAK